MYVHLMLGRQALRTSFAGARLVDRIGGDDLDPERAEDTSTIGLPMSSSARLYECPTTRMRVRSRCAAARLEQRLLQAGELDGRVRAAPLGAVVGATRRQAGPPQLACERDHARPLVHGVGSVDVVGHERQVGHGVAHDVVGAHELDAEVLVGVSATRAAG